MQDNDAEMIEFPKWRPFDNNEFREWFGVNDLSHIDLYIFELLEYHLLNCGYPKAQYAEQAKLFIEDSFADEVWGVVCATCGLRPHLYCICEQEEDNFNDLAEYSDMPGFDLALNLAGHNVLVEIICSKLNVPTKAKIVAIGDDVQNHLVGDIVLMPRYIGEGMFSHAKHNSHYAFIKDSDILSTVINDKVFEEIVESYT